MACEAPEPGVRERHRDRLRSEYRTAGNLHHVQVELRAWKERLATHGDLRFAADDATAYMALVKAVSVAAAARIDPRFLSL